MKLFSLDNKKISIIFIFSLIFISFTQLRLFNLPIGLGEIGLLLLGFFGIRKILLIKKIEIIKYLYDDIFVKYFIVFIVLLLGAYIWTNTIVDIHKSNTNFIHDILAYGFIFYIILVFKILDKYLQINFEIIMSNMILYIIVGYGVLFVFSLIFGEIIGISQKYPTIIRFMGLSNNPNQVALIFIIIPFILISFYKNNNIEKEYVSGLLLLSILISYTIHSRALIVAFITSLLIVIFYNIYIKLSKYGKIILISMLFISSLSIVFYFNEIVLTMFSGGIGGFTHRVELWTNAIELIKSSPFIGFGPGAHVNSIVNINTSWEVHNTFLDLTVQTGLIGLFFYLVLLYKIGKNLYINGDKYLMGAFIALIIFSTFHFILRQPIFWFYLFYFYQVGREKKCVQ